MNKTLKILAAGALLVTLGSCGGGEQPKTFEKMFQDLQSSFKVSGNLVYSYYETAEGEVADSDTSVILNSYASGFNYQEEHDTEGVLTYQVYLAKDTKGNVVQQSLNTMNEVESVSVVDDNGQSIAWDSSYFVNPFIGVSASSFTLLSGSDSVYSFSGDDAVVGKIITSITGYSDFEAATFESLEVEVSKDGIIGVSVTSNRMYFEDYEVYASLSFEGVVENVGNNVVPTVQPFEHETYHDALATAFETLRQNNYTLAVVDVDPSGDYPDVNYGLFATSNAFYSKSTVVVGTSEMTVYSGYVEEGENLSSFNSYDESNTAYRVSSFEGEGIEAVANDFECALEIFELTGDNEFTIHSEVSGGAAIFDFTGLSDFIDSSFVLTLGQDGNVESFKFSYNVWGFIIGDVTGTYSNIGTTTSSIDFENMADASNWYEADINVHATLIDILGDEYFFPYVNLTCSYESSSYSSYILTENLQETVEEAMSSYATALLANGYTADATLNSYTNSDISVTVVLEDYDGELLINIDA